MGLSFCTQLVFIPLLSYLKENHRACESCFSCKVSSNIISALWYFYQYCKRDFGVFAWNQNYATVFYTESSCKINRWLAVICLVEVETLCLLCGPCVNHLHIYVPSNCFPLYTWNFNNLSTSVFISITIKNIEYKTAATLQPNALSHCVQAHRLDWVTGGLLTEALNVQ